MSGLRCSAQIVVLGDCSGEWKERKITPDLWQIGYAVTKRRAGRAPEGSGVPVGTEYHWYIVAHQNTTKRTANDYTTSMADLKFKIAHKRAGSGQWSMTSRTQRLVRAARSSIKRRRRRRHRASRASVPARRSTSRA